MIFCKGVFACHIAVCSWNLIWNWNPRSKYTQHAIFRSSSVGTSSAISNIAWMRIISVSERHTHRLLAAKKRTVMTREVADTTCSSSGSSALVRRQSCTAESNHFRARHSISSRSYTKTERSLEALVTKRPSEDTASPVMASWWWLFSPRKVNGFKLTLSTVPLCVPTAKDVREKLVQLWKCRKSL